MKIKKYRDLAEYAETTGLKKYVIARTLGISPYRMSGLLHHGDRLDVSDELVERIAALLNQKSAYVRRELYPLRQKAA